MVVPEWSKAGRGGVWKESCRSEKMHRSQETMERQAAVDILRDRHKRNPAKEGEEWENTQMGIENLGAYMERSFI